MYKTITSQMSINEVIEQGDYEVVKSFLEKDPSLINHWNVLEDPPLHIAIYKGDASIVKLLLDYKVDLFEKNTKHKTPLGWIVLQHKDAITDQHHEIVKLLLQAGILAHKLTTLDRKNDSLLNTATCNRHAEIVRLFLMHGANPNALDNQGMPAWYKAYPFADTLCAFLKHPSIDLRIACDHGNAILLSIVYSMTTSIRVSEIRLPETLKMHEERLKYFIFGGADVDDQAIKEVCNPYLPDDDPNLYLYIKWIIDKAVVTKQKAETEFHKLGLPSLLVKHFLLSSKDIRDKVFYLSLKHSEAERAHHKHPLFKIPLEVFIQIIEEVLVDGYRFPNLTSDRRQGTSPRA